MLSGRYGNKKTQTEDIIKSMLEGTFQPSKIEEYMLPSSKASSQNIAPTKEKEEDRTWFKGGAFSDGYDFGDVTKTILGTAGDIGTGVIKGTGNLAEGLVDLGAYGVAGVGSLFGADTSGVKEFAKKEYINEGLAPISDFFDRSSLIGDKGDAIAEGLGYVGGILLTGGLGASAGLGTAGVTALTTTTTGLSAMGSGMGEAYKGGATDGEAVTYGLISGIAEAGTELIFGGLGKTFKATGLSHGLSSADDMLAKKISSKLSNQLAKNFAEFGVKATAEGSEEVMAGVLQAIGKKVTYMKEEELSQIIDDENLFEQFITGAVTSGIAQSGYIPSMQQGSLREANKTGRDFITGYTQNEQTVVDKVVEKRVAEQQKDGTKLTNKEINEITEEVQQYLERGLIDTDTIESVLGGETYTKLQNTKTEIETLQKEATELENKPNAEITVKERERLDEIRTKLEEISTTDIESQLQKEIAQKTASDSFLQRSYYEKAQKRKPFTYEANEKMSELEKVVYDSASRVMNNTTRSHELADTVAKLSKDTGTKYVFVNNEMLKRHYKDLKKYTKSDTAIINGLVNKKGEVLINVQSPKILEKIIGHEITHLLEGTKEYKAFQDAILEYAMRKGEYNVRLQSLTKMYEGTDANIDAEITSDLGGDYLFTDQDFVNHLSTKQPNVFQKVYNYIKHLAKQFTAGSKEARQLEKVKYRFEQAYRSAQKTGQKTDTKYSIQGLENYTTDEIKEQSTNYIKEKLETNGIQGVTIIDSAIHGSRGRGTAKADSDLDIVVEYDGDIREDTLFDILNEEPMYIDGVKVDINPINKNKSGTLKEYMERSDAYDKEVLAKQDTKYSLTDNQGRELTKEQQEYFKDSKVRDENGNLLVVYHGTPNGDFTVFRDGTYFTDNKEYADTYQHEGASSISTGKVATNPKTFEVYLNIKKPFDINDAEARDIYINEYIKGGNAMGINPYLSDAEYDKIKTIDWTEGEDLREFLIENGYDYDGLILDEGGTGGYGEEVKSRGLSYVIFNANQVKSVDNTNPTENPDIRYSLSDNKGRELTKEQQVYFKDSKARDENGNLLTLYHGTNADFNVFKKGKKGYLGPSIYLSDEKSNAERYTDYGMIKEVYANITNPLIVTSDNPDKQILKAAYGSDTVYNRRAAKQGLATFIVNSNDLKKLQGMGYDGIIWKHPSGNEYTVFNPNQLKNIDNTNPTENPDITMSLSDSDYAETSQKGTRGEDVRLQEAIAPIQETINNLSEQLTRIEERITSREDYAPVNEANLPELEQQYTDSFNTIDDNIAPVEQENDNVETEPNAPTKGLLETRDYAEVGNRKVKAYQYEHPEVRPYFQEAAEGMLYDLENSIKGERNFNDQLYYDTNGEEGFYGTTRHTAEDIAELLDGIDGKYKLSYKDIRKGLEAIIEDHGAENNAASKRIEMYLDKRLREGYTEMSMGMFIPPNQEYLSVIEGIEYNDYYSNMPIDESAVPPRIAENVIKDSQTPRENVKEEIPAFEDVATQRRIDFDNQVLTDEPVSELEKKKARELKKLGKKEDYISNRADELYDEVKHLRKGVKASYELGRVLDVAFAHIDEHIKGKTEDQAHEIRKAIWRRVTTALKDVTRSPIQTVNEHSKVEKEVRRVLNWEYDSKKKDIDSLKDEDLVKKTKRELRKALLIDESDFFINALDNAKNRSMALMNNTDTIRNTELVFGRANAKIINEKIFQKEIDNESDSIAWQNKEREEIKNLGIKARSKESAAVQKYGEKQYANEEGKVFEYGDKELAMEFPDVATQEKIKNAAKVIRSKYDTYIDEANNVLTKLGFDPIKKRNDYMRHFQELNDVFSRYGIPFNAQNMQEHSLPTDINGLTEFWSPQKNYFANMQARKGVKTTYDAITGIDGYIGGIANLIYHTEDIQRGRAFEELIRETYGEDKGFDNLANLPEELQQARIEKIQDNHLSNYAAWVHEWTNNVAGKKSKIDRSVESMFGRKAFSFLDTARKQVGANMIGFNLSSSLTNLIAPVQAMAKTNKLAVAKGTADTIKNMFIKDDFMSKNKFLTSRMGTDMLSRTAWQKVQDAGYIFMKGMDWFSSNQIVRSKYYELRAKGMSEEQAHAEAGQFAARIMGNRTKGANPQLYNSKLIGLVTQFQLEVNNQLYSMFYDTYHESKENAQGNAKAMAKGMTFTLGQLFVFTHVFGQTFKAIAGYNPTFDIIGIIATALGLGDEEDEEKTTSERLKKAADMLVDALPYVNTLTGGGRIPVASGIPNLVGVATGGKDEYGNELTLGGEMKKLLYLVPPTGGNQIKKTTQGLGMFDEDLPVSGSYTNSGNLRFPVEDTVQNRIQAGLFGQYASENARDYFDNERAPLKEKQIQEYADLDMPIKDYWDYREGLAKQSKLEDKFNYIDSLDVTTRQKNIMINNVVDRKESVDMSNYSDFGSYEEFDFATKNKEKYEFLQANNIPYSKYTASEESREAYNWAFNNPEKYTISKAVADDVVTYRRYASELNDIKADKNSEGKSISGSRKEKVLDYVNNLDADYGAKIILYKMEYPSDNSYNYDIIEYLDDREDISYEDMVTILTELDMKVEGSRIWWD